MDLSRNEIRFKLDKKVQSNDLDALSMYLENQNESNGLNTVASNLDTSNHVLSVIYEDFVVKQRVLTKIFHKCLNYNLIAFDQITSLDYFIENKNSMINKRKMILKNANLLNDDIVNKVLELYVGYLQPYNPIEKIDMYNLFDKTFLATFKNDVDFEVAMKKHARHPSLRGKLIKIFQVYDFNSIIVRKYEFTYENLVYLCDANKDKTVKIYEIDEFVVLFNFNIDLTAEHNFFVQNLFNIEIILNDEISAYQNENVVNVNEIKVNEENPTESSMVIKLDKFDIFNDLLLESENILNSFQQTLKNKNAVITINVANKQIEIKKTSNKSQEYKIWHEDVMNMKKSFEDNLLFSDTVYIKHDEIVDMESLKHAIKHYIDLNKVSCTFRLDNRSILLYGFKKAVRSAKEEIERLLNKETESALVERTALKTFSNYPEENIESNTNAINDTSNNLLNILMNMSSWFQNRKYEKLKEN